jgi:hypothetical protein
MPSSAPRRPNCSAGFSAWTFVRTPIHSFGALSPPIPVEARRVSRYVISKMRLFGMGRDDEACAMNEGLHGWLLPWQNPGTLMRSMTVAFLALGVGALSGCGTQPCDTTYRGGCMGGPAVQPSVTAPSSPPPAPVVAAPAVAPPAAVVPTAPAVPYGDPSTFADVDDKQCRSYGLTFGSHDYADCRLRLSAQHRGLDPNVGTTPSGSGIR